MKRSHGDVAALYNSCLLIYFRKLTPLSWYSDVILKHLNIDVSDINFCGWIFLQF